MTASPTSDHASAINMVSNFIAASDIPSMMQCEAFDVIVLCGNSILPIAEHLFSALETRPDLAKYLVISGGIGHSTEFLCQSLSLHPLYRSMSNSVQGLPEALILDQILEKYYATASMTQLGLQILVEDKSTNCGANASETKKILDEKGVHPRSILIVQDPTMSLRTKAAFAKVYADAAERPSLQCCPTFVPQVALEDSRLGFAVPGVKASSLWPMKRFLDLIIGEIPRLRDDEKGYGPRGKGFISHVSIPPGIESSWSLLKNAFQSRR